MTDATFDIQRRTAEDGPGQYDDEVAALLSADEDLTEEDEAAGIFNSLTIQVPATYKRNKRNEDGELEEVEMDAAPRYKRFFQESAKKANRTARVVSEKRNESDNTLRIEFRLVDLVKRPRGAKDESEAEAA